MNSQNPFTIDNPNLEKITICRTKDTISTELDGETVILDIAAGVYSGLDQVGTTIWNEVENPVTVSHLIDIMMDQYDVSRSRCTGDLCDFLKGLLDNKLIDIQREVIA